MNSDFAVAPRDMYQTRFSEIEVIRKAGVIKQKRQNRKKEKKKIKKRAIKTHKNDWHLFVMKNKWTRSSFLVQRDTANWT